VKVVPRSIQHEDPKKPNCENDRHMMISGKPLKSGEKLNITYTYSVSYQVSPGLVSRTGYIGLGEVKYQKLCFSRKMMM
jgi:hypothetical protein